MAHYSYPTDSNVQLTFLVYFIDSAVALRKYAIQSRN